ncbi:MAG: hypothetical protein M3Y69_05775 [Verrucomicrobiota bacterium]|nr:hypothetical protein [Verrucomicrobiota bacterium]
MHKDKPPGIFEFTARPVQHAVTLGLATGVVLSILTYVGMTLWGADATARHAEPAGRESLEETTSTIPRPNASATPSAPPAIQY